MNAHACLHDALLQLGDWLAPASRADSPLPSAVQARAQRLWLDTAACAWAGLQSPEPLRWLDAQAAEERGPVALPGSRHSLGAAAAATAVGLAACWDEACEGLALAHGRPGVPVVAALWSQIPARQPDWAALWRATALGYEVSARLGARLRIRPGMHVDAVWGAFGAAAAVTWLHGGGWPDVLRALEACASQLPVSLYRPVREGANVRNLYLGHSAWLGLQGARASLAGLGVAAGCIDDFAQLVLDPAQAGAWPPPGDWLMLQSYWKPFAAVRHVHYGAQAALMLRQQWGDGPAPERLRLHVYPEALQYCPNRAPATVLAAQFSLSFGVAAAWVHGDLSPAEFRAPRRDDAAVRVLETRVELIADPQAFPDGRRGARLEASGGGRCLSWAQGPVAGDAGCEPDDAAVMAKFSQFTQGDAGMARWAQALRSEPPDARAWLPASGD